ncbi:MAG: hypothetical protein WBA13_09945 [Microcoleaceae cyanobacterium]
MILIKGLTLAISLFSANFLAIPSQTLISPSAHSILLAEVEETADFPIPEDAMNYSTSPSEVGEAVNFQTELGLTEAIEFYRNQLIEQGLTEREINTAITNTTFNLVFEGAKNGLVVVVQGVELGNLRNVNIRFEDLD